MEYTQNRSEFWLKIYENDDSTTLLANAMTARAISIRYPSIVQASKRKGWKPSGSAYSLWIRDDHMDWGAYAEMEEWADVAGNQRIWLSTNKNTERFFSGNELDFCIAYDWNFDFSSNSKTDVGEAEYQMKWHPSVENERLYGDMLKEAIETCCDCLPYDCRANHFVVTAIPATVSAQNKPAWKLAKYVAETFGLPMISLTLAQEKPFMKNMSIADKVSKWKEILLNPHCFSTPFNELRLSLQNRNVLIIDDLYQSGASIWCLTEYLKRSLGVNIVQSATVVKAMRDSDNL